MTRFWIGSAVALTFLFVHAVWADDEEEAAKAKAKKTILELAKMIEKGEKGVADKAAAAKKGGMELEFIMLGFKPTKNKGIGIGKEGPGDGIELKINTLGRTALSKMALAKEKDDLLRLAYINLAIAELTFHYAPAKKGTKGPKEWKQYTEDMKAASNAFIQAVKAGDPMKLKTAANDLAASCTNCHGDFRDI